MTPSDTAVKSLTDLQLVAHLLNLLSRDTAFETKIGIWCPGALFSFFSLTLIFLSLLSHSTVASPVPVQFRATGLVPSLGENLRSSNESQVSNRKW